jgi:hypothetical protein
MELNNFYTANLQYTCNPLFHEFLKNQESLHVFYKPLYLTYYLAHGSPTMTSRIVRPAVTFVNSVDAMKIIQLFKQLGSPLTVTFTRVA